MRFEVLIEGSQDDMCRREVYIEGDKFDVTDGCLEIFKNTGDSQVTTAFLGAPGKWVYMRPVTEKTVTP
jgi:hypothetical protein